MTSKAKSSPRKWETHRVLVPGFGLSESWLWRHLDSKPADESTLSLFRPLTFKKKGKKITCIAFVTLLRSGTFKKWLGHKDTAFRHGQGSYAGMVCDHAVGS